MTISLVGLIVLLLVGAIVGAIAEAVVGYSPGGFLATAAIGFLGAFIGSWLAPKIGLPELLPVTIDGVTIPVIWAIVGAIILVLVLSLIRRPYRRRRAI
ncbi:MAG: GlsB/YeaQ/YmgE family stress response membrane protein [Roseiflexaceae bacterium]